MPRKISEEKKKLLEEIYKEYLRDKEAGYYDLSVKYNIPYSTLRRYILQRLKEDNIESEKDYVEFPFEGFECLKEGDTFSWSEASETIFKAVKKARVSGELIWIFVKTNEKSKRHFIPETLDICKEKLWKI